MSAIQDEDAYNGLDHMMIYEKNRLESFKTWPIKSGKCTKEAMAKAGFYHCKIKKENVMVRCFFCFQCLSEWDKNDDPHEEHLKSNPNCTFAKLNKEQSYLTIDELDLVIRERLKNLIKIKFKNNGIDEIYQQISKITDIINQL